MTTRRSRLGWTHSEEARCKMSGRWDEKEYELKRIYDEQHGGGHNHRGDNDGPDDNNNGGWRPRHHDPYPPEDNTKKSIQSPRHQDFMKV